MYSNDVLAAHYLHVHAVKAGTSGAAAMICTSAVRPIRVSVRRTAWLYLTRLPECNEAHSSFLEPAHNGRVHLVADKDADGLHGRSTISCIGAAPK